MIACYIAHLFHEFSGSISKVEGGQLQQKLLLFRRSSRGTNITIAFIITATATNTIDLHVIVIDVSCIAFTNIN